MFSTLEPRPFTAALHAAVQGFDCGSESWERAMALWITGQEAIDSITNRGTQVFLYYDGSNQLVGFGSIGTTHWSWPPPNGRRTELAIIPALAVQKRFWGHPKGRSVAPSDKYSRQILSDLIGRAKLLPVTALALFVHKDNTHAIALYREIEFERVGELKNDHYKMALPLRVDTNAA